MDNLASLAIQTENIGTKEELIILKNSIVVLAPKTNFTLYFLFLSSRREIKEEYISFCEFLEQINF
jgi:hypothetical protein